MPPCHVLYNCSSRVELLSYQLTWIIVRSCSQDNQKKKRTSSSRRVSNIRVRDIESCSVLLSSFEPLRQHLRSVVRSQATYWIGIRVNCLQSRGSFIFCCFYYYNFSWCLSQVTLYKSFILCSFFFISLKQPNDSLTTNWKINIIKYIIC